MHRAELQIQEALSGLYDVAGCHWMANGITQEQPRSSWSVRPQATVKLLEHTPKLHLKSCGDEGAMLLKPAGKRPSLRNVARSASLRLSHVVQASEDAPKNPRNLPPDSAIINAGAGWTSCTKQDEEFKRSSVLLYRASSRCVVPMVHPESLLRVSWLMLGLVMTMYDLYAIPFRLAFSSSTDTSMVRIIINMYYIVDVHLNFFVGYFNNKGYLQIQPTMVWMNYFRTWFLFDLLASVPWEWIEMSNSSLAVTRAVKPIRAINLISLVRVFRLAKIKSVVDLVESTIQGNYVLMFIIGISRVIFSLFITTHWAACAWWAVGATSQPTTWVNSIEALFPDVKTNSWTAYVCSLYYTLTTMTTVGYGDVSPKNTTEVKFALGLLTLAAIFFAGQMGVLNDLISRVNSRSAEIHEKKIALARYLSWRAVPHHLSQTIRKYLIFLWDTNEGHDAYEDVLKDMLPPSLRLDLCHHIYGEVLQGLPFLLWIADYPDVVKELSLKMSSKFLEAGDVMFRAGQTNTTVFIVLTGKVRITKNERVYVNRRGHVRHHQTLMIPRHKEMGVVETGLRVVQRGKEEIKNEFLNAMQELAQGKTGKSDAQQAGPVTTSCPTTPPREPKGWTALKLSERQSDDSVFRVAMVALDEDDRRLDAAATLLQRKWRERKELERQSKVEGGTVPSDNPLAGNDRASVLPPKNDSRASVLTSTHLVSAPAFFGESCLWIPIKEWNGGTYQTHTYSCWCSARCEVVFLQRTAIQELLDSFKPWLQWRFEAFAESYTSGVNTRYPDTVWSAVKW